MWPLHLMFINFHNWLSVFSFALWTGRALMKKLAIRCKKKKKKKISGSGFKFNCAAWVGSGRVRRSRVRAGFGLQFKARADL